MRRPVVRVLAKAHRQLPDKWHGLADVDTRYRQRYVDLIANDDARRVFEIRFAVGRRDARAASPSAASSRSRRRCSTRSPAVRPPGRSSRTTTRFDVDLYLRIAPELYLKRLIVGGFDRVFEIARVFRNEGISTRHNPEFTMLELYAGVRRLHRHDDASPRSSPRTRRGQRSARRSSSGTARRSTSHRRGRGAR